MKKEENLETYRRNETFRNRLGIHKVKRNLRMALSVPVFLFAKLKLVPTD